MRLKKQHRACPLRALITAPTSCPWLQCLRGPLHTTLPLTAHKGLSVIPRASSHPGPQAAAAASDADHVAAAARDAAALQLQLQQLAIAASLAADALGATVAGGPAAAGSSAAAGSVVGDDGSGSLAGAESSTSPDRAAVLRKLREVDREREQRIAADFHAAIQVGRDCGRFGVWGGCSGLWVSAAVGSGGMQVGHGAVRTVPSC